MNSTASPDNLPVTTDNDPEAISKEYFDRQLTTLAKKADRSPRKIPMPLIEDALHESRGNVSKACKLLRTSYVNLARIVDTNHHLIAICEAYRSEMFDLAERNLRASLEEGNMKSTYFTLTRLGKDKGYVEKRETETTVRQESAVDLSKLSTDQLQQMRDMLTEAGIQSGDIIDVTPESSDEN